MVFVACDKGGMQAQVEARFANGLLEVELHRPEADRPKMIQIKELKTTERQVPSKLDGSERTRSRPVFVPRTDIYETKDNVVRIFDDFWKRFDQPFSALGRWDAGGPRTDIAETESALDVTVELPGIDQKDVEVSLTNSALTIKGEKKSEREESKKSYHLSERSYGSFYRSIPLPSGVDTDKANAEFKNGVLTVTLPKTQEALSRVKKIEAKAN